jgi:formylglycine-generating enzyme required for sulfatase activity
MGAGLWGQLDLAGEMNEWVLDVFATYPATACVNCAYLEPTTERIIRGGDFRDIAADMLPPARATDTATIRTDIVGFRCARPP